MFRFEYPYVFLLFLLIPPVVYFRWRRRREERSIAFSSFRLLEGAGLEASVWKRYARIVLRIAVLLLLVLALARPQTGQSESVIHTEGVDILLVMDVSGSMQAQDFKPKNRLEAAKGVVREFIAKRPNDRIGLVAFAAQAITQCPVTPDHDVLTRLVQEVDIGMLEDGTAVGVALATACNRLKNSEAQSRVVVLLTDGQNNAGSVDPTTAAKVAHSLGIKVYTIGVGTRGVVPMPVNDPLLGRRVVPMKVDIDTDTLKRIADITKGKFFLATDSEELKEIYNKIDELEKTKIESKTFTNYTDRFAWFVLPALCLLFIELVMRELILREIP
ncbi:MAG: VWA domain-containing protein [Candidatus Latescibacterota bacterium]